MLCIFILEILLISHSSAIFQLSGEPAGVVLGDDKDVTLNCIVDTATNGTALQWFRGDETGALSMAIIFGIYEDKSCILLNPNLNYTFLCYPSVKQYKLVIPSAYIINGIQNYKWRCSPLSGTGGSNTIKIGLLVPVTMVAITPSNDNNIMNAVNGKATTFTCTTNHGRPAAWIQWYIGENNFTSKAQPQPPQKEGDTFISSSELVYTGKEGDHNKTIYCEALNIEGRIKVKSPVKYIYIKLPVTNVTIQPTTDNNTINVVEGQNRTFTCTTDFCRPAAWIQWYVDGQNKTDMAQPQPAEYNGDLVKSSSKFVYNGNDDDHNKTIICEALNIEGGKTVQSKNLSIHIQVAVTNVIIKPEGDNNFINVVTDNEQNFTCTTDAGRPAALIQWYIGGRNVTGGAKLQILQDGSKFISTSILTYNGMEKNHNESITCEATNFEGISKVKSKEKYIFIQIPVTSVTITPTGHNNVIDVVEGSQQNFTCITNMSRPAAWIHWYIDNTRVTSGVQQQTPEQTGDKFVSSSKLLYTGLEVNHNKKIQCEASNIEGQDKKKSKDKFIYIQVPVTNILFIPSGVENMVYALEGRTTNLTCITNPIRPRAWIQWYIGGKNVTNEAITKIIQNTGQNENTLNSSSLLVYNATENDHNKTVYCEAVNIEGRMKIRSTKKNLYIQYGPKELSVIPDTKAYIVTETEGINLIQCSAKCRPTCRYSWTGTDDFGNLKPYLNLSSIYRNQSGEYNCSASNDFGSTSSFDIKITVRYAPTVLDLIALTGNVIAEHQSVTLQCNIDSYPLSDVTWLFSRTKTKLKNDADVQQSIYTIKEADCLQTGIYQCNASNVIGNNLQDVELFVNCSTRIDHREHKVPPIFGINDADLLNITVYLIAYPPPSIHWIFTDKNRQNTTISSTENFNVYEHQSNIMNLKVDADDFGVYTIYASNTIGEEYIYSINVIPQKKPNRPSNVSVECGIYSMTVFWKSEFDGGDTQRFMVTWFDNNRNITKYSDYIMDKGFDTYHMITSQSLRPDTLYYIFVNSTNKHGTVISVEHVNCSTKTVPTKADQSATTTVIGGIVGSLLGISIAAAVMIYWKRRKNTNEDKEPIERSKKETGEEENDELTDNPLYITSEINSGAENGAVYSTVDKTKKKGLEDAANFGVGDQGPVYSEVNKGGKNVLPVDNQDGNGKQKGKKGKKGSSNPSGQKKKGKHTRDIEMGNVYSNTKGILHEDNDEEVYANAESKFESKKSIGKMYIPRKNKDGLIYADLDLNPSTSGNKFVIRGLENRTNYAIIDLNIKVDPLPSDDEDDRDEDKKTDHKDGLE